VKIRARLHLPDFFDLETLLHTIGYPIQIVYIFDDKVDLYRKQIQLTNNN